MNENKLKKRQNYILNLSFLIGSTKMNGFYYLLCLFFFLLLFNKKICLNFKISVAVFISVFCYYLLHSQISLMSVYDRPYGIQFDSSVHGLFKYGKDLSLFIKYSFIDSWNFPIKYSQSDTMLNILALDLYGDYYSYGIEKFKNNLIELNRKGLILSHIFFPLFIINLCFYHFKDTLKKFPLLIFFNS